MRSNLVAHHLRVLEEAGIITRSRSEADHRRVYVRLRPEALIALTPKAVLRVPRVVFVCTHNTARSQLAAALWQRRSTVPAASAGTRPGPRVHERALATAQRHGLRPLTEHTAHVRDVVRAADVVISMGCDDACPVFPGKRYLDWTVPDPAGQGVAAVRPIRDDIEQRVRTLLAELAITV